MYIAKVFHEKLFIYADIKEIRIQNDLCVVENFRPLTTTFLAIQFLFTSEPRC